MFKVNDVVKIIGNRNFHKFEIGYTVKIINVEPGDYDTGYQCYNGDECWYVDERDMEKVN